MVMSGLSIASLKKNYSLIPLFVFTGIGMVGSMLYVLRLATKSPEVSWNKKSNPEPWNYYKDKQHHFYSPNGFDTAKIKEERPDF